jgi:hypothetical protein
MCTLSTMVKHGPEFGIRRKGGEEGMNKRRGGKEGMGGMRERKGKKVTNEGGATAERLTARKLEHDDGLAAGREESRKRKGREREKRKSSDQRRVVLR